nr:hypothetical protein [uncultured Allomuricauda sp.]
MLNKILGIALIIIAVISSLLFLFGLPGIFTELADVISDSSAYGWGKLTGYLMANLTVGLVAFFAFRLGLKLYKKPS